MIAPLGLERKSYMGTVPHKVVTLQSLTSRLTNHPSKTSKTYWALREKQGQLISNILLWSPTHGYTHVGWSPKSYLYQLYAYTECHVEDLPRARIQTDGKRESQGNPCLMMMMMMKYTWRKKRTEKWDQNKRQGLNTNMCSNLLLLSLFHVLSLNNS